MYSFNKSELFTRCNANVNKIWKWGWDIQNLFSGSLLFCNKMILDWVKDTKTISNITVFRVIVNQKLKSTNQACVKLRNCFKAKSTSDFLKTVKIFFWRKKRMKKRTKNDRERIRERRKKRKEKLWRKEKEK